MSRELAIPSTVFFWLLSVGDLLLTKVAVEQFGAREINPAMLVALEHGTLSAFLFKTMAAAVVMLIAWAFWSRRAIRWTVLAGNLLLVTVIGYQLWGIVKSMGAATPW